MGLGDNKDPQGDVIGMFQLSNVPYREVLLVVDVVIASGVWVWIGSKGDVFISSSIIA